MSDPQEGRRSMKQSTRGRDHDLEREAAEVKMDGCEEDVAAVPLGIRKEAISSVDATG
jgi:hypothetical protein